MRTLRFLLQKEFRQVFRNKTLLRAILAMPMVQLIVLPWAANYEVKNISLAVVDNDHSQSSQQLITKIVSSGYFKMSGYNASFREASQLIDKDKADIVLEIPQHFGRNLVREKEQKVFVAVNAINGTKAVVGAAYISTIIGSFSGDVRLQWMQPGRYNPAPTISIVSSNWYNPLMNYQVFMVPGILVMLVTMVGSMMCALNIVKEKEIGTIEQVNVTPIRKHHFILGKLIPFWVIGMVIFSIGLVISRVVYGIVPAGNIGLLYAFLAVYLLAVLGIGLLISTYSTTQQQAMSLSFFFIMIFNMMSGLFTPVESMPEWAQVIARMNPMTYFIEVMRMVVLKGSGFRDVATNFLIVCGFAVGLNVWAVLNYRKTS